MLCGLQMLFRCNNSGEIMEYKEKIKTQTCLDLESKKSKYMYMHIAYS